MNSLIQEQFEELASALIDGDLDEQGGVELCSLLESYPDLAKELKSHLGISEQLSQQSPFRADDHVITTLTEHIASLSPDGEAEQFVGTITGKIRSGRIIRCVTRRALIAAALVALVIPLGFFVMRETAPIVAQATHFDSDENSEIRKEVRKGESIALESGIMRLEFQNGAVVAVESPAQFLVVSDMLIELKLGKLNAWCPETAHGFQVVTSDTTLTDLGTSFGIEAIPGGDSKFVVIEGSVELHRGNETHVLQEGSAMSTGKGSALYVSSFETSPYKRTWALSSGIAKTTGSVVPAKPDTPERLARLFNDKEVMVVPEGRGLPFNEPLTVEISEPGHLEITMPSVPLVVVEPVENLLLNSYLVRVDPETELEGPEHIHFEGSVTFEHPVIGIIIGNATLKASDIRFGKSEWPRVPGADNYHRGLETNWNTTIHDEVSLSKDRRTVTIVFHTGGSTDDIRVITAEKMVTAR